MILAPIYSSSEPPPASGPVRSKTTPILIFFSWAWAEKPIVSAATAAKSPATRRAVFCPSILSSRDLHFTLFLSLAYHIDSRQRCQAALRCKRVARRLARAGRSGGELPLDKGGHEARHRGDDIGLRAYQPDRRQFRVLLPRQIGLDASAQGLARHGDVEDTDQRDRSAPAHAIPVRRRLVIGRRQPGLLLDLAREAAGDIAAVANDVAGIGRAGREINSSRGRGVRPHLGHDKGAVGAS